MEKDTLTVVYNNSDHVHGLTFTGVHASSMEVLVDEISPASFRAEFGTVVLMDSKGRFFHAVPDISFFRLPSFGELNLAAFRCNACGEVIVEENGDIAAEPKAKAPKGSGLYNAMKQHAKKHPNLGLDLDVNDYFTRVESEVEGDGE